MSIGSNQSDNGHQPRQLSSSSSSSKRSAVVSPSRSNQSRQPRYEPAPSLPEDRPTQLSDDLARRIIRQARTREVNMSAVIHDLALPTHIAIPLIFKAKECFIEHASDHQIVLRLQEYYSLM